MKQQHRFDVLPQGHDAVESITDLDVAQPGAQWRDQLHTLHHH